MITDDSQEMFKNRHVIIFGDAHDSLKQLAKSFQAKGAQVEITHEAQALRSRPKSDELDVLVYAIGTQVELKHKRFAVELVENGPKIKVFWTISEKHVPFTDGFTPKKFKPSELLKPIYYSLLLVEDVRAHG